MAETLKMVGKNKINENLDQLKQTHFGCQIVRCAVCFYLNIRKPLIFLDDFSLHSAQVMANPFVGSLTLSRHLNIQTIMLAHSYKQITNEIKLNTQIMIFANKTALNDMFGHQKCSMNIDEKKEHNSKFTEMKLKNQWSSYVIDFSEGDSQSLVISPRYGIFPVFCN